MILTSIPFRQQMTGDDIIDHFRSKGVTRGGETYLPPGAALEVVNALDSADFAVLGIEGARITEDTTEPDLGLIAICADESQLDWSIYKRSANECARRFLARLPAQPDLFVTMTTHSSVERRGY